MKVFVKGDWKPLPVGTTLTIKSRSALWTMVTGTMGDGKIASGAIEGACAKAAASTSDEESEEPGGKAALLEAVTGESTDDDEEETKVEEKAKEPVPAAPPPPPRAPEKQRPAYRANESDLDKPAPSSGGGMGGWIMAGVGAALVVGGGGAALFGSLPYFEYTSLCQTSFGGTNCPAMENIAEEYRTDPDANDRADIAGDAGKLRGDIDNAAQEWDQGSSVLMGAGIGAAGVGLVLMVGGVVWAIAAGGEPTEDGELQ